MQRPPLSLPCVNIQGAALRTASASRAGLGPPLPRWLKPAPTPGHEGADVLSRERAARRRDTLARPPDLPPKNWSRCNVRPGPEKKGGKDGHYGRFPFRTNFGNRTNFRTFIHRTQ